MSSSEWLACGPYSDSWIPSPAFRAGGGGDDLQLIGRTGANSLVHAGPDVALEVARQVAAEIPGGCTRILVFDCHLVSRARVHGLLEQYLRREWRQLDAGILLLRECHALSDQNQEALADLLGQRRRAEPFTRIMGSTSVPLYDRVRTGHFNPVLYYLLNTVSIAGDILGGRPIRLPGPRPLLIRYVAEEQGA